MPSATHRTLRFDVFDVDLKTRELRRQGELVPLQDKPFRLLLLLLENPGQLVTRDDIRQRLWSSDTFVEFDDSLNHAVKKLREALGDSPAKPRFIETLSRRGYRFVAPVNTASSTHNVEPKSPSVSKEAVALAVLPFLNLSSDPSDEYFGDSLAEEIINALARVPGIRVAARTSAFQFRGAAHDLANIADRLNVRTIVEGSVRRAGDRVRVTAQFVDLADGYQIWSERYDRQIGDIFAIQDDIAQAIVEQLKVRVTGHVKQPLIKRPTQNLPAYHAYLKGRYYLLKLIPETLEKSRRYFEQAIAEDPQYASPYVGLAGYYFILAIFSLAVPKEAIAKSREMVQKALQLDHTLDDAHSMLGTLLSIGDHQWDEADQEFQRALALNPVSPSIHNSYSVWLLMPLGRLEQALAHNGLALDLDPLSPLYHFTRGWILYNSREYDHAVEECHKVLELDPNYHLVHRILARVHWQRGCFDDGIASLHQATALFRMRPSAMLGALGISYAAAGRHEEARRILSELKELTVRGYVRASVFGEIYLALGEIDNAWGWFQKAIEDQDPAMITVGIDPFFDSVRNDVRYGELLRRMRLPAKS
jgi:adenylate cyclase